MKPAARAAALVCLFAVLWSASAGSAEETLYRVTVLTRNGGYLLVSGGDALRVAPDCACANLPAGTVAVLRLDGGGRVIELRRSSGSEKVAEKLPAGAIAIDPRSARTAQNAGAAVNDVTVTLVVAVPADTPQGDDLYVSTSRSGWSASELRMERLDPQHWSLALRVPVNLTLLYRYSRGSFATLEADRSGQLFPARKLVAKNGLVVHDTVVRFADTN